MIPIFDLESQVSSPNPDAFPVTSYYLSSARPLDSHPSPAPTTSSLPQTPMIYVQPHRRTSVTRFLEHTLKSDPLTRRRRQTYGLRLAPEDHEALGSNLNQTLRPNTAAASVHITLSESYEILPFGPPCSLKQFPSNTPDGGLSSRLLNSSSSGSVISSLLPAGSSSVASRPASESSSSSLLDISDCAVPPRSLAASTAPAAAAQSLQKLCL